jgi:hypothetical protein
MQSSIRQHAPANTSIRVPKKNMTTSVPIAASNRRFLFLLASTRRDGNAELLARRAAAALPGDVAQRWLRLADLPLPAFEDVRHAQGGSYAMKRWPRPTLCSQRRFTGTACQRPPSYILITGRAGCA